MTNPNENYSLVLDKEIKEAVTRYYEKTGSLVTDIQVNWVTPLGDKATCMTLYTKMKNNYMEG